MASEIGYEEMAELVDSIDISHPGEEASLDVSKILANRLTVKKVGYDEADKLLESMTLKPTTPQQEQSQVQQPHAQAQVLGRETLHAAADAAMSLKNMVGGAGKEFAESVERKVEEVKEAGLVMNKLSVQDQLTDLEKIKEGMDENAFDNEQLKVIAEEVKGMAQISAREDMSKMSEDQRELVLMRNQRIKEIRDRLNIR